MKDRINCADSVMVSLLIHGFVFRRLEDLRRRQKQKMPVLSEDAARE